MQAKLNLIAAKARQDKREKFTSLIHLINEENLAKCYSELKRNKACGIDEMTVEEYGVNLKERLSSLLDLVSQYTATDSKSHDHSHSSA